MSMCEYVVCECEQHLTWRPSPGCLWSGTPSMTRSCTLPATPTYLQWVGQSVNKHIYLSQCLQLVWNYIFFKTEFVHQLQTESEQYRREKCSRRHGSKRRTRAPLYGKIIIKQFAYGFYMVDLKVSLHHSCPIHTESLYNSRCMLHY